MAFFEASAAHKYNFRLTYERDITPQQCVHENFGKRDFPEELPTLNGSDLRRHRSPRSAGIPPVSPGRHLWLPPQKGTHTQLLPLAALPGSPRYKWSMNVATVRRKTTKTLAKYVNSTLSAVAKPLLTSMSPEGTLNSSTFSAAMAEAGCADIGVLNQVLTDLDLYVENVVRVNVIIPALHCLILGDCRSMTAAYVFKVLDPLESGFLKVSTFTEMKTKGKRSLGPDPRVTPAIVRAIVEAFQLMSKEEEQRYIETVVLKGKGGKKKKPPALKSNQKSYLPLDYKPKSHMSLSEFERYLTMLPSLVSACLPIFLECFLDAHKIHATVHEYIQKVLDAESTQRVGQKEGENAS